MHGQSLIKVSGEIVGAFMHGQSLIKVSGEIVGAFMHGQSFGSVQPLTRNIKQGEGLVK